MTDRTGYDRDGLYNRPAQTNYAKSSWWAVHGAEIGGGIAGFGAGFAVYLLVELLAPSSDLAWLPWVTLLVGAVGLRVVVKRKLTRPAAPTQRR